jgi:hypothetical protein
MECYTPQEVEEAVREVLNGYVLVIDGHVHGRIYDHLTAMHMQEHIMSRLRRERP